MTNKKINFAFFGTSEFSVYVLNALKTRGMVPDVIITQPDRPRGRGLKLSASIAKLWAEANHVQVLQPESFNDPKFKSELSNANYQLFLVASYGKIIPKAIYEMPQYGTLNVHPSLLPKYRGPSPIQAAILNGDTETGVCIMQINERMDEGPIVISKKIDLFQKETSEDLEQVLGEMGGNLLTDIMPAWITGQITAQKQDASKATYSKLLEKKDGEIDFSQDPTINDRKFRAFKGNIGTYFLFNDGKKMSRIKIIDASLQNGTFIVKKIIPEGKKEITWESWTKSRQP